jgi:ribose transport system substrate-binding protein
MRKKMTRRVVAALVTGIFALSLMACGGNGNGGGDAAPTPATETETEADDNGNGEAVAPAGDSDIVVGFLPGSSGSSFRQIGIAKFTEVAEGYVAEGRIRDFRIVNNTTDGDATEQANLVRAMINDGDVNVLVVNPNSPTELNGVLEEAVEAGMIVVSANTEVDVPGVYNVSVEHYEWGARAARYVAEALQPDGGNVIHIHGLEGHPANNERIRGAEAVLAEFDNINVLATTTGGWNQGRAMEAATQILGTGQHIDGIVTQDAMTHGILTAFNDMGVYPRVTFLEIGTASVALYREMAASSPHEIQFFAQPNPPSIVASGLRFAVNLAEARAEGRDVDHDQLGGIFGRPTTAYFEVQFTFTEETLEEMALLVEGEADDFIFTETWSESEVQRFFR